MTVSNDYIYKGDYVLNKIDIIDQNGLVLDLIPLYLECNIFESIWNNTLSGNIILTDAQGIFDELKINGGEIIVISFYTTAKPESIFEKRFYVMSITDIKNYSQSSYVYNLGFVSSEEYSNASSIVKESYSGTISDIAKKIFEKLDSEKEFYVEETKYLNDIIIPFWKPFNTLNWLTKRAISSENDKTGFLFFENKEGFNFKSIQSLFQNDSDLEYVYNPKSEDKIDVYMDFEMNDPNFLLEKLHNGSLFSKINTLDISTRTFNEKEISYLDIFSERKSLDKKAVPIEYTYKDFSSNSMYLLKDSKSVNNSDNYENNIFNFRSVLSQCNNHSVTIITPGNTDVTVGYNAICKILKTMSTEEIKYCDFGYRKMLISEIKHNIKPESYYQTITLIKDSYSE